MGVSATRTPGVYDYGDGWRAQWIGDCPADGPSICKSSHNNTGARAPRPSLATMYSVEQITSHVLHIIEELACAGPTAQIA